MKLLGIETSTYSLSVAIVDDDNVLGELSLNIGPKHSERLIPIIDWLLKEVGMERKEIEGIAVSIGPGSFTSLRVGISAAKGLAFSLGIPVVGVSSLDVLAGNVLFSSITVCTLIDAKKKEVFAAFFRSSGKFINRISEDVVISPQALCDMVHEKTIFIGDGAVTYRDLLESNLGGLAFFCPPSFNLPRASNCVFVGATRLKNERGDDLSTLAPRYLRKAEAEIYKEGVIR